MKDMTKLRLRYAALGLALAPAAIFAVDRIADHKAGTLREYDAIVEFSSHVDLIEYQRRSASDLLKLAREEASRKDYAKAGKDVDDAKGHMEIGEDLCPLKETGIGISCIENNFGPLRREMDEISKSLRNSDK
jgi:hypothetical protein